MLLLYAVLTNLWKLRARRCGGFVCSIRFASAFGIAITACVPSNSRAVLLDDVFRHVNQAPVKPARFNPRITVGTLRMAFQRIPVL